MCGVHPLKSFNFQVANFLIFHRKKTTVSSRVIQSDLYFSPHWRSLNPLKGYLTIPKRSPLESPQAPSFETHRLEHFKCPPFFAAVFQLLRRIRMRLAYLGENVGGSVALKNVGPLEPFGTCWKYRPWGHVDRGLCFNQNYILYESISYS